MPNETIASFIERITLEGKITPDEATQKLRLLAWAQGTGPDMLAMVMSDFDRLPPAYAPEYAGANLDSANDDLRIRAKCREFGGDPRNPNDYAEAMDALRIDY